MQLNPFDAPHDPLPQGRTPPKLAGLHDNPCGDDRFYNNLFVGARRLEPVRCGATARVDGRQRVPQRRQALQA